jgi:hypothetical protein
MHLPLPFGNALLKNGKQRRQRPWPSVIPPYLIMMFLIVVIVSACICIVFGFASTARRDPRCLLLAMVRFAAR